MPCKDDDDMYDGPADPDDDDDDVSLCDAPEAQQVGDTVLKVGVHFHICKTKNTLLIGL
jgi:hypothetical protein